MHVAFFQSTNASLIVAETQMRFESGYYEFRFFVYFWPSPVL
jgi:hypothetical protein